MIKGYKWQSIAFAKQFEGLLSQIGSQNINILEYRLLIEQARIIFADQKEESRCLQLFKTFKRINKKELVSSIALVGIEIRHCKQFYIVRLRPTPHQIEHRSQNCFQFWMGLMREKYGPIHIWFEQLCQEQDARRASIQLFVSHLKRILKQTAHKDCAQKISMFFQKSKRNQIQAKVFTNTLIIHRKLMGKSIIAKQRKGTMSESYTHFKQHRTETKQSESLRKNSFQEINSSSRKKKLYSFSTTQRYLVSAKSKLSVNNLSMHAS